MNITTSSKQPVRKYRKYYDNLVELEACRASFLYFLKNYVRIQTRAKPPQTVRWETWPYLIDLANLFLTINNLIIVKARQLGISWLVAAYGLWLVLFNDNAKVLFLSQGEVEAWDLLAKSRFIWSQLPDFMRLQADNDTRAWLHFKANASEIKALPSTDKAGRSTDATLVVRDECAYHPFAEDNFAAIGPCIDAGGQSIDLSTVDRQNPDNHFAGRAKEAMQGAELKTLQSGVELYGGGYSGASLVFLSWRLRPVRRAGMTLDDWYELEVKRKYPPAQREKEYPASLAEALKPSAAKAFFDIEALNEMEMQVEHPLRDFKEFNTFNGIVRVYKKPVIGRRYAVFTDPSNGIADPFVTGVMDIATGECVCSATASLPAQEVARIHDTLVRAYNNAFNSGEVNAQAGATFMDTLIALDTPCLAPRRSADGKIQLGKIGWQTTPPLRDKSLHDLAEAVRRQLITIHDRDCVNEMRNFILVKDAPEDKGKLQAAGRGHDDWVMMWAGLWQIARYAPTGRYVITSSKYRS